MSKSILYLFILLTFFSRVYSQLNLQWKAAYNGPANSIDKTTDMAVDQQGSIYVTGESEGQGTFSDMCTVKYNSLGIQQWANRVNGGYALSQDKGKAITVDQSGNVYVTGEVMTSGPNYNVVTVKYNSAGVQQWSQVFDYLSNDEKPEDIILDNSGNVYICGWSSGLYLLLKYNNNGVQQWYTRIQNASGDPSLAVDNSGNMYICGSKYETVYNSTDFYVAKYTNTNTLAWTNLYAGSGNNADYACAVKIDNSGNLFAAGYVTTSQTNTDFCTIKYNSTTGDTNWVRFFSSPGSQIDKAFTMQIDASSNVYVTGKYSDVLLNAAVKYNSSGELQWSQQYNIYLIDKMFSYIDGAGNFYAGNPYFVTKYNPSGNAEWYYDAVAVNDTLSNLNSVAVDGASNVLISGSILRQLSNYDYCIAKFTQPIGIKPISSEIPSRFSLSQNYPNPFNPSTKIRFQIPLLKGVDAEGRQGVLLKVYDILGREIATLVNEQLQPGTYEVEWDGTKYTSGMYLYRIQSGDYYETKKLILLK